MNWNLFIFRWLVYTLYFSFIIIVPFCYIKIFKHRKNLTIPGSGQTQKEMTKFRKSRNIVTFSYNITIWILETLAVILVQYTGWIIQTVCFLLTFTNFRILILILILKNTRDWGELFIFNKFIIYCSQVSFYGYRETNTNLLQIGYIVYITVTCGLTPGLYILGNL